MTKKIHVKEMDKNLKFKSIIVIIMRNYQYCIRIIFI